jgi:hypothetical protein
MSNKKYVATDITGLTPGTVGTLAVWDGSVFVNLPVGTDGDALVADSLAPAGLSYASAGGAVDPYLVINSGPPTGFFGFPGDVLLAPEAGVVKPLVTRYLPATGELSSVFPSGLIPGTFIVSTGVSDPNVALVLSPKGTGGLRAHAADGTVVGGNARGNNAVDWQTDRNSAAQVASGNISVVGGGSRNTASGGYATIGGGGSHTASGQNSTVGGGSNNTASNLYATIGGGASNTASGNTSTVGGGSVNTASGTYAAIAGGLFNTAGLLCAVGGGELNVASGHRAAIAGGERGLANQYGMFSHASGRFSTNGDAQYSRMVLRRQTTDATPALLTADGTAGGADDFIALANNTALCVTVQVSARENATGDMAWWKFEVGIKRGASAAATAIVGPIFKTTAADAGASAWDVTLTADTTNGALAVTATGEAGKTIRWVATVHMTKVSG